jgi:hypothetical protein
MLHFLLITEIVQEAKKSKVIYDLRSLGIGNPTTMNMSNSSFLSLPLLYMTLGYAGQEERGDNICKSKKKMLFFPIKITKISPKNILLHFWSV